MCRSGKYCDTRSDNFASIFGDFMIENLNKFHFKSIMETAKCFLMKE